MSAKEKPTLGKGPLVFKPLAEEGPKRIDGLGFHFAEHAERPGFYTMAVGEGEIEDDGDVTLHPQIGASRTARFDTAMQTLTADRGAVYGPPSEDFARINALKKGVASCDNDAVRHALEMICVKMARLCQSPNHYDSALDIAGYARTIMMVLDEEENDDA